MAGAQTKEETDGRWRAPTVLSVSCFCQELIDLAGRARGPAAARGPHSGQWALCGLKGEGRSRSSGSPGFPCKWIAGTCRSPPFTPFPVSWSRTRYLDRATPAATARRPVSSASCAVREESAWPGQQGRMAEARHSQGSKCSGTIFSSSAALMSGDCDGSL